MKHFALLLIVVVAFVGLSGCTIAPLSDLEFLSADTAGRSVGNPPEAVDNLGGEGAEGDGGEAARTVTEPDVVRRIGNLLYILNQHRGLLIVDLDTLTLLGQAPTYGFPRDLYVEDGRAYVLVGQAQDLAAVDAFGYYEAQSRLYIVDVATPSNPQVNDSVDIEGDLVDSRLVGDVLYTATAAYTWYTVGAEVAKQQDSGSWITSVRIGDDGEATAADTLRFEGYGTVIHATPTGFFVAAPDWQQNRTQITCVDISDTTGLLAVGGTVAVPGQVADRFKLDVWQGVLRVASNTSWPERDVFVSTIDINNIYAPALLGQTRLENAAGETLFATRFEGDRAYLVTFLRVDPLFVLDLSDPASPQVLGELEVPGWSTHIVPQGDRLLALGVDDTGRGNRVKVSLYNVADPARPFEADSVSFGEGWSWSNAYDDVKSFTVLDDLLLVPVSGWDPQTGQSFERLQFITYNAAGLELAGVADLRGRALRSFEYDEELFTLTPEQLVAIDDSNRNTPTITAALTLAEYIADFMELSSGVQAEVITAFADGETVVRTRDTNGVLLDSLAVAGPQFAAAHVHGDEIVLVHTGWDERAFYTVTVVDATNAAALTAGETLRVDVDPYWGGGYYYGGGPEIALDALVAYPYWGVGGSSYVAGNYLALRCFATAFDAVVGEETPYQGLAIVDLATTALVGTLGLAYEQVNTVATAGDRLYVGTKTAVGSDLIGRPMCAHYVHELDLQNLAVAREANVPGVWVQYDAPTEVLVLEDYQYSGLGAFERTLRTVAWTGTQVTPIDHYDMAQAYGAVTPANSALYVESYDDGHRLQQIQRSTAGELSAGPVFNLGNDWSYLLGAQDNDVFVVHGGRALAHYRFDTDPVQGELTPVMSSPLGLRFGEAGALIALGYSGTLTAP